MTEPQHLFAGLALTSVLAAVGLVLASPGLSSTLVETLGAPTSIGSDAADVEPAAEPSWESANWWTYEVTIGDGEPQRIAVIVHDTGQEGYHVGTNGSRGFLGLPIDGTFSNDLNPTFAGETWRMYDFPLHDGKAWDQTFLGYNVNTTVQAAELEGADGGTTEGYALEATAYGRTVATYSYHPQAQWFDELVIHDPQNGERVFQAQLVDHGTTWDEAYYVTEPVHEITLEYPLEAPGDYTFEVPPEYNQARVHLGVVVEAGAASASVHDGRGEEVADADVLANGYQLESTTVDNTRGAWRLSHAGTGDARVTLEVLGVKAITPEEADPAGQPGGSGPLSSPVTPSGDDPVASLETSG